ncbi:MAG TPA: methyltransferase domain-containing protein [Nocardioides sp.]
MDCHHYDAGRCRSCSLLEVPRARQLSDKEAHARSLVDCPVWLPTFAGEESGFRNKAKMAVGGTSAEPTLGLLDRDLAGLDIRDCGLHSPGIRAALPVVAAFVTRADLTPYDVRERRGELKHVLLTESPDRELMLRLVLRSTATEARVRKHLPWLVEQLPRLRVVSLNIQPAHAAVLEGEREIVLTDAATLPMRLEGVDLALRPQSFFQTNTAVAEALYAQAAAWVGDVVPGSVTGRRPGAPSASPGDRLRIWDLYCGVGGFARVLAGPGREVTGVDVAPGPSDEDVTLVEADATAWAREQEHPPDLVVVNPPRRGIGAELADWLEESGVEHVVYSSCNAETLARDLAAMPSLRPVQARVLDMFPHTSHFEVITLLARR